MPPLVLVGSDPPSASLPSATNGPLSPTGQKPNPSSEKSTVGVKLS
jgi:hypothetical protein